MIAPRRNIGLFVLSGNDFALMETRLSAAAIYSRTKQQHKDVADAGQKMRTCNRWLLALLKSDLPCAQEDVIRKAAVVIGRGE